uniref:Cytochrome c oxidase subunit 2 n=1 Tax=Diptera sp. 66 LC-2017 TaxID=2030344 RepID=A0A343L9Z6_9DIPT|nr:cytochrome c oxidase subunit 2 [Diptera sp. 66 LC-2017]
MSWTNLNFQNSNSPLMEQLIFFHDHSMLILILITNLVSYIMISMLMNNYNNYFLLSGQTIEIIWTIIPAIILLFIAFPSLKLLYLLEETNKPYISIKTIGHQWYWKYEYSNLYLEFDSYMYNSINNNFRLLDTDNRVILPFNYFIRILVTAMDVIHSWTVPSLGIKVDATPGRLNQLNFLINRSSIFYGQCSEICGANHSFMPITIESINLKYFLKWIKLNN